MSIQKVNYVLLKYFVRACDLLIFIWSLFILDFNSAIPQYSVKWWALFCGEMLVVIGLEWLLRKKTKRHNNDR